MVPSGNTLFTFPGDTIPPVWHTLDYGSLPVGSDPDTLYADPPEVPVTQIVRNFFPASVVKEPNQMPVQRNHTDNDWIYGSFAMLLLVIVLLRITWRRELSELFRAIIFPLRGSADTRPFEFRINSFSVLFMLIYSMSFSFLLISAAHELLLNSYLEPTQMATLFFIVAFSFLLLILYKLLLAWFTARVFQTREAGQLYRDHLLLSAFTSAAAIIPLMVVNVFTPSHIPLIMALVIMAASVLVRLFRTLFVGTVLTPFSHVHVFLYFCTLEIIPLLLIGNLIYRMQAHW